MSKLTLQPEGDRHVVAGRRFAASPEAVYRAHTEPSLIQQWLLGPEGWTMPVCVNEARPGGRIRYEWADGKGGGFFLTGEFVELVPSSRLVHVERMHLESMNLPSPTPDNRVETEFAADGAGTLMTMRMTLPDAAARTAMLATGMEHGMEASYVRLESLLRPNGGKATTFAEGRDLVLTRMIEAPPAKVFRAWTEPALLRQWFAPLPWTTPKVELDLRPGGSVLFVMRGPDGEEFPNHGVYLEVVENERLVTTDAFPRAWEPSDKPFMTLEVTLEDHGGRTRYTARVRHWTVADREAHETMGFHEGWAICAEQLAALAERL